MREPSICGDRGGRRRYPNAAFAVAALTLAGVSGRVMGAADVYIETSGSGATNEPPVGAVLVQRSDILATVDAGGTFLLNTDDFDGPGDGEVIFARNANFFFNNNSGTPGTFVIHAAGGVFTGEVGMLSNGNTPFNIEYHAGSPLTANPLATADVNQYGQSLSTGGGYITFSAENQVRVRVPANSGGGAITMISRGATNGSQIRFLRSNGYARSSNGAGLAGPIVLQADSFYVNSSALADANPRIDADGAGGVVTIFPYHDSEISLGDGGAGLNLFSALAARTRAETLNVGNPEATSRNDSGISVHSVNMAHIGTTVFNPRYAGAVQLVGTSEFANVRVDADETGSLNFNIRDDGAGEAIADTMSAADFTNTNGVAELSVEIDNGVSVSVGDHFTLIDYETFGGGFANVGDEELLKVNGYSILIDYNEDLGGGNLALTATICDDGSSPDSDNDGAPDSCDVCPNRKPGDIDGDASVSISDAAAFSGVLLAPNEAGADAFCAADLNRDGAVNSLDIQPFMESILNP
ncbi:MAG TPA: dockerin type I repeat-containing protein [Phycisphaerae bacterium]|nr:dockerin type I repeat-containing protein [Phycisphaerae bacterium]HRW55801.1 dockerin type I repeat-containing protein [Phycisphaerae bacterium]